MLDKVEAKKNPDNPAEPTKSRVRNNHMERPSFNEWTHLLAELRRIIPNVKPLTVLCTAPPTPTASLAAGWDNDAVEVSTPGTQGG